MLITFASFVCLPLSLVVVITTRTRRSVQEADPSGDYGMHSASQKLSAAEDFPCGFFAYHGMAWDSSRLFPHSPKSPVCSVPRTGDSFAKKKKKIRKKKKTAIVGKLLAPKC